jgi:hypothetical protein
LEVGVHFAQLLDDLCSFVFGEEAANGICPTTGSADEGVFGFLVGGFPGVERAKELGVVFEISPRFFPSGIFVEGDIGTGTDTG